MGCGYNTFDGYFKFTGTTLTPEEIAKKFEEFKEKTLKQIENNEITVYKGLYNELNYVDHTIEFENNKFIFDGEKWKVGELHFWTTKLIEFAEKNDIGIYGSVLCNTSDDEFDPIVLEINEHHQFLIRAICIGSEKDLKGYDESFYNLVTCIGPDVSRGSVKFEEIKPLRKR